MVFYTFFFTNTLLLDLFSWFFEKLKEVVAILCPLENALLFFIITTKLCCIYALVLFHPWLENGSFPDKMITLFHNKGLWMYLEKLLSIGTNDNYDLSCLKNDEALGLIILYVEPNLVHHTTKNNSAK
jgi:hypothetical protein